MCKQTHHAIPTPKRSEIETMTKYRTLQSTLLAALACITLSLLTLQPAIAQDTPEETTPPTESTEFSLTRKITIPLQNGKIDFGDLLAIVTEELGFDGTKIRKHINWQFRPDTHMGRGPLMAIETATNDVVQFAIQPDSLVITYDRIKFHRESKRIRGKIRTYITRFFPDAAAAAQARYGFRIHADLQHQNLAPEKFDFQGNLSRNKKFVILVHGLDDPRKIWETVRPVLLKNNYIVCEFDYPNDQAIADSAEFLAQELELLKKLGLTEASIVAHSMGGLVTRETLTNPEYYEGDSSGGGRFPSLDKFIMTGVPNQGSQMARFHFATEIRDQIARTLSGDGLIFDGFFDGAGEAKIDLLPNSEFLHTLNARPLPAPIQITIISGIASPVGNKKIEALLKRYQEKIPGEGDPDIKAQAFAESLKNLSAGFGDGCVSLKSSKLAGVTDHEILAGNHVTVIRNQAHHDPDRIAPAVAIILDRLAKSPDQ